MAPVGLGPEKYPRIIAKTCPLGPDFIHAVSSGIGEVDPEDLLHVSSLGFDSSIQLFNLISRASVKVTKMEIDQCGTLKVNLSWGISPTASVKSFSSTLEHENGLKTNQFPSMVRNCKAHLMRVYCH